MIFHVLIAASIIASAIPAASVRGTRTSALADRGVRGLCCHAEGPQVADTVIEALDGTWQVGQEMMREYPDLRGF